MRVRLVAAPVLAVLVAAPAIAQAHIALTYPAPRVPDLKFPNCGATGAPRSTSPTVFEPGQTITVTWNETINHPGHYRVSFDDDGEDFTIPLDFDDTSQSTNVLFDLIPDVSGQSAYSQQITLPDIECETCTIQVIQMMTDKPPYGDGNDIYFQCADIALRRGGGGGGGAPDAGTDPGGGGDDDGGGTPSGATGGCSSSGAADLGAAALVLGAAALLAPRRRRAHARRG